MNVVRNVYVDDDGLYKKIKSISRVVCVYIVTFLFYNNAGRLSVRFFRTTIVNEYREPRPYTLFPRALHVQLHNYLFIRAGRDNIVYYATRRGDTAVVRT